MKNTDPDTVYDLIRAVRLTFNRLKTFSDTMNSDDRITAAMRAVMEYVAANGPDTVPNIARAKSVTRQHIQMLADALAEAGLATFQDNPGHKRSKLLALTDDGCTVFDAIRKREAQALADIARSLDEEQTRRAVDCLDALNAALGKADPAQY